jgi:cob(I)alamin adenosyltransferase
MRHPFQEDPDRPPTLQPPVSFTQGLVQIYTGNGKGKSTAAMGLALRAVGHGLRVYAALFLKGDMRYGEFEAVKHLPNVTLARFGPDYLVDMLNVKEEEKALARQALDQARAAMLSGNYDLVILDEINVAVAWKLLDVEAVASLIQERPAAVELVLTGRYAPARLLDLADLVTEMRQVKHPYEKGILCREGIDY